MLSFPASENQVPSLGREERQRFIGLGFLLLLFLKQCSSCYVLVGMCCFCDEDSDIKLRINYSVFYRDSVLSSIWEGRSFFKSQKQFFRRQLRAVLNAVSRMQYQEYSISVIQLQVTGDCILASQFRWEMTYISCVPLKSFL